MSRMRSRTNIQVHLYRDNDMNLQYRITIRLLCLVERIRKLSWEDIKTEPLGATKALTTIDRKQASPQKESPRLASKQIWPSKQ